GVNAQALWGVQIGVSNQVGAQVNEDRKPGRRPNVPESYRVEKELRRNIPKHARTRVCGSGRPQRRSVQQNSHKKGPGTSMASESDLHNHHPGVRSAYKHVVRRNPYEPEFQQAVLEVLDNLSPALERHPEYDEQRILRSEEHTSELQSR